MRFNHLICLILFQFISIALFGNNDIAYYEKAPLIDHLNSINKQWNKQKDLPTDLLTIPMKFNTDEERIQLHLKLVESILNKRSSDHLSIQQFANRKKNLKSLVEYWNEGQFPINTRHSHRQPYFIDDYGTACAVGHLLLTSGEEQLAHHISDVQNYAYIHEMRYAELDEWAVENGFTKDELAWIQPGYDGYYCYDTQTLNGSNYFLVGPTGPAQIHVMKTLPDESMMLIGGDFMHFYGDFAEPNRAIFGYDGNNHIGFGNAIQGTVYDIEYYNEQIYAAGDFVLSGTDFYNIAYWDGTAWVGIQTGNMNGIIKDIEIYECQLYVGGDFTTINGGSMADLAIWDGTTWSATPRNCLGQTANQTLQVNAPVNTFERYNGKLAIGGEFTQVNSTSAEGLIFLDDLNPEFLPTHGSIASVDNLASYESVLVVGADSVCAYRWNKWYYPSDTVSQYDLNSPFLVEEWQIPEIGKTNDIFFRPYDDWAGGLGDMIHLVIVATDRVWGLNSREAFLTYNSDTDFSFTANGDVFTTNKFQDRTYFGGNFDGISVASYPDPGGCYGFRSANSVFELVRIGLLPIELTEFTVKSDDNKTAQLAWTSLTENNSSHYEIERRTDNEDFMRVGTVAAAGESLEEINYIYEDDISKVSGNYVYYRLKMVDKDGSYEYSDVRSLRLETRDSGISIAPNPAVNSVELSMKMAASGDVNVHIYDMQGRQLCAYQWTYDDNSIVRERIDVSHLEAGLYLVEVVSPHERKTMKLDVLK